MEQLIQTQGEKISWYRTRWFWGVVFGVIGFFIIGITYLFLFAASGSNSPKLNQIFGYLLITSGGTFFYFLGTTIFAKIGGWLGSAIYYTGIAILLFKTFQKKQVGLIYPISIFLIVLCGFFWGMLFISSFN